MTVFDVLVICHVLGHLRQFQNRIATQSLTLPKQFNAQHHKNRIQFVLIQAFCSRLTATSTVHPFSVCYCSSIDTTIKTFHDTHKFIINCQFSHASTFVCSAPRRAGVERDGKSYNLHKIEIIKFAASRIAFN